MGEMRDRMPRGELYIADDPDNAAEFARVPELLGAFNGAAPGAWDERDAILRRMLRHVRERVVVRAPFSCEDGAIAIGDGTFVNIDPEPRRLGWEYGEPITIGRDTVVGAGAVVTRDLPAGVVAAGVPARILREIGERDRVEVPVRSA